MNNKIKLIKKENKISEKNILIIGVFHGDEPQGEYFINSYLQKDFLFKNNLYFIPKLNSSNKRKNISSYPKEIILKRRHGVKFSNIGQKLVFTYKRQNIKNIDQG